MKASPSVKIIALCFAFLFIFICFTACKKDKEPMLTQSEITKTDVSTSETPRLFEKGTWYDGREFRVLISGNSEYSDFNGDNIEAVSQAKHSQIKTISDKYGIVFKLDDKTAPNSAGGEGIGYIALKDDYYSESKVYDSAMLSSYDAVNASCRGYLSNLNSDSFTYLDLSKSWWSKNASREFSIDGMLFCTTGDISLSENKNTYCILFNKVIEASSGMKSSYEAVKEGKWTLDFLNSQVLEAKAFVQYGVLCDSDGILAAYTGAECRIAEITENEKLELSAYSPSSVSIIEKFIELLNTDAVSIKKDETDFSLGKSAFCITTLERAESLIKTDLQLGFLPIPKLSEDKTDYSCLVSPHYTQLLCVPYYVKDKAFISGVLEELAYSGKKEVTEAYKNSFLKDRFEQIEKDTLDLIFASASFDIGMNYKIGGFAASLADMSLTGLNTFSDIYINLKSNASTEIKEINECFNNISKSLKYQ